MKNPNVIVKEISDDEGVTIDVSLGISKERSELLRQVLMKNLKALPRYSAVIAACSEECLHANELAYIALVMGRLIGSHDPGKRGMTIVIGKDKD